MATKLHVELQQTRPWDLLEEEAHVSIGRTAALLERAFAQMLKPYGITPTQYNVLRILRGAGAAGLCRNEVGARLVTPVPDVTRLLDRMADLKLIARQRSDEDRRLVRTHLTAKGLDLVNSLDAVLRPSHQTRLAGIPRDRITSLVETLAEIRANL
ncbi:MAG: MarR family transcriptional regulator [Acidobacteria bacterium]|nr:MarR family transcriptional regulator [Acidobacteriota bacterium]